MRRPNILLYSLLLSSLALCAAANAQQSLTSRDLPTDVAAKASAKTFLQQRAKGRETGAKIDHVMRDLKWHKSLDKAQAAAKKHKRPILWIQLLGDLTGYT